MNNIANPDSAKPTEKYSTATTADEFAVFLLNLVNFNKEQTREIHAKKEIDYVCAGKEVKAPVDIYVIDTVPVEDYIRFIQVNRVSTRVR